MLYCAVLWPGDSYFINSLFYVYYNVLCMLFRMSKISVQEWHPPKRKPSQVRTTAKFTEKNAVQSVDSLSVNPRKKKTIEPDGDNTDTGSPGKGPAPAKDLTELQSKGFIKFISKTCSGSWKSWRKKSKRSFDVGQMFRSNSFTEILSSLVENKLPQVGCCDRKEIFITNIIMDFMCCRMKCI